MSTEPLPEKYWLTDDLVTEDRLQAWLVRRIFIGTTDDPPDDIQVGDIYAMRQT